MKDRSLPSPSEERLAVLDRIRALEAAGIFDKDVENDPPTKPLDYHRVDYLSEKRRTRLATALANRVATAYYERLIRRGEFLLDGVLGIENLLACRGGALFTCNHFSALDNYAVWRAVRPHFGKQRLYKIIREGNYTSFPGLYGYMFRHCNTLPLASNPHGLRKAIDSAKLLLCRGERVLIYPEQAMWWNYKKPRPCKPAAYYAAVEAGVPVLPFFITLRDSEAIGKDGFPIPYHTVHILPPLYPDTTLQKREAAEALAKQNYDAWCSLYREVYGRPVVYCED